MPPLFSKHQEIFHQNFKTRYEVLQTPDTCVHNGRRCYQLRQLGVGPKAGAFYREQNDVEKFWIPLND